MANIHLKRIYQGYDEQDGFRILVDRLWPRGIKKENAHIDLWLKAIAPTDELRKWFNHEREKWPEFQKRYLSEIKGNAEASKELLAALNGKDKVTILFGAKDEACNQAVVIKNWLNDQGIS